MRSFQVSALEIRQIRQNIKLNVDIEENTFKDK